MQTALIIIGVLLFLLIIIYNGIVRSKNNIKNAESGVDVQLKRRFNLIPNLIETVKTYMNHESDLLSKLTQARTAMMSAAETKNPTEIAKTENQFGQTMKSLFAVSENYPDLKSNQNFLKLQEELAETENQISAARRIFNQNVTDYNNKISIFPNNVLANMFGFTAQQVFEADETEKAPVSVKF